MRLRKWARPWMVWLIGYPVFLVERLADAHNDAKLDVRDLIENDE